MPLRCIGPEGQNLQSFELEEESWRILKEENRARRNLRMPCCDSQVVLKKSKWGTKFFAHKARGPCATAPESAEHMRLKSIAAEAAILASWNAVTEVSGSTPNGEVWVADVLAENEKRKVAIEIQWSNQSHDETLRRQLRYKESGIRGLWLMRRLVGYPSKMLPALKVVGNIEDGFHVMVRNTVGESPEQLPIATFLAAVFSGQFRFGIPFGATGEVVVHIGSKECWRTACKAETKVVKRVEIRFGPYSRSLSIPNLGEFPEPLAMVCSRIPTTSGITSIKRRYSRTQERHYWSNGCWKCDSLFGELFSLSDLYEVGESFISFPINLSEQWGPVFDAAMGDSAVGWHVHDWQLLPKAS